MRHQQMRVATHPSTAWGPPLLCRTKICIYACMHICIYICMYTYHTCLSQTQICLNIYIVCVCVYIYVYYVYICTHLHIHIERESERQEKSERERVSEKEIPPHPNTARYIYIRGYSIRQHTSAYVSIRQHTSAYVSMRDIYVGPRTLSGF
jgi:Ca2+/H+ antiporter